MRSMLSWLADDKVIWEPPDATAVAYDATGPDVVRGTMGGVPVEDGFKAFRVETGVEVIGFWVDMVRVLLLPLRVIGDAATGCAFPADIALRDRTAPPDPLLFGGEPDVDAPAASLVGVEGGTAAKMAIFDLGIARLTSTCQNIDISKMSPIFTGMEEQAHTTFPPMMCSLTSQTLSTLSSLSNTINPNPRDLCVSRLNMTSAEYTFPNCSK